MITPKFIEKGDTIAIISVSSKQPKEPDTALIRKVIDSLGYAVKYGKYIGANHEPSFGATDSQRAEDFMTMVEDKNVKAILLFNGGYGAVRILEYLDCKVFRKNPKWVAGFSDATALHHWIAKCGMKSMHSTMPKKFFKENKVIDSLSINSLFDALSGKKTSIKVIPDSLSLNQKGMAIGKLWGGNLSLIYAVAATPIDNDFTKGDWILFIEDLSEEIYHVDRMMQNLYQSGKLARLKGIIVGQFTNIKTLERFNLRSTEQIISRYTSKYNIPVLFEFPAGHSFPNRTIVMGETVKLTVNQEGGVLEKLKEHPKKQKTTNHK